MSDDTLIEPTTVELYGTDGRIYHTAAGSEFAENGLKDGTLTAEPPAQADTTEPAQGEEATPNAPEVPPAGDAAKSGKRSGNRGPGDGGNPPA
ncbi:hypothetical protein L3Q65_46115 [Amycolatopsis sp. FU40]|uniref:hypothetical protein n=1 Tax=Amycolatopsis sp. FU40 TaxID=2914159 RepID=UPI001F2C4A74|nr:hypothetical protein [Amycolatopsis sp. FU40]UKD55151.1 hypothetical protein L3Q65_46115 [Amycolatopsis sp. FU40]